MFSVILSKEQFINSLSSLSENEINKKISDLNEMLLLLEQVKPSKNTDTVDHEWYFFSQLLPDEKVVEEIQTYGNNLKGPKNIEVTNMGRVFYKDLLLKPQRDSHGNFGVWYPHVGWRAKNNGVCYKVRYEFSSPIANQYSKYLYSRDKVFFDEIDSQWQSMSRKRSKTPITKNHKVDNRSSDTSETCLDSQYIEGVYAGDGIYFSQETFDSFGFDEND